MPQRSGDGFTRSAVAIIAGIYPGAVNLVGELIKFPMRLEGIRIRSTLLPINEW
jgi:hypothetical protein